MSFWGGFLSAFGIHPTQCVRCMECKNTEEVDIFEWSDRSPSELSKPISKWCKHCSRNSRGGISAYEDGSAFLEKIRSVHATIRYHKNISGDTPLGYVTKNGEFKTMTA